MIPQMIRRRQKRRNHHRETRNSSGKSGSKTRWRAGEGTTKKPHYYYYYCWAFNEPRSNEHFTTLHNTSQEHADPTPRSQEQEHAFSSQEHAAHKASNTAAPRSKHSHSTYEPEVSSHPPAATRMKGKTTGSSFSESRRAARKSSRVLGRLKFGIRRGTGFLIGPAVMIYKPGASAWVR